MTQTSRQIAIAFLLIAFSSTDARAANWVKVSDQVWLDTQSVYRSESGQTVNFHAYFGPDTEQGRTFMSMGGSLLTIACDARQEMNEFGDVRDMSPDEPLYRFLCK